MSLSLLRRSLVAASLVAPALLGAQEGIAVGSAAPNASLETLDGRPAQLSTWIGKQPVVLEFWASWCGVCKALEPQMAQVSRAFGSRVKFVVVAVSANQTPEKVRQHMAQHPMPVETLYDRTGAASDAYDVPATSFIVVIDRAGKVVYTGTGSAQNLTAAVRKAL